jgi:muramoyltetrapeptide carboxypeptidase
MLAEKLLKLMGLRGRVGKNAIKQTGNRECSVSERVDDLHEAFRDNQARAIFAIGGRFGAAQLLDRLIMI